LKFIYPCDINEITMSYQVLAQKYRPQKFEDVIGQEAVTRTLTNSVKAGRVANAYIFCGPRGVGKTSVARLLSKTLNCEKPPEESPCNKCPSCDQITRSSSIDVLEIDGASNRGIDEIRTLRENVKFSPSQGRYKIYIIDEVHMLTQEAFNALLKTLEEPPAHVKFIFATTEPHKVLPTIMSRCQRFDFRKISPGMILDRIKDIAGKEKIKMDDKAALLIARAADGSLRDALVILDQMVSFSGGKVTSEDVTELLGMVHKDRMLELSGAVIDKESKHVAAVLDDMIDAGKDPVFIATSLIGHYRDLMILKTAGKQTSDMALTDDECRAMLGQAEKLSLEEILYILQNLSNCIILMKGTVFARGALEITLIRLTKRGDILSLPDIMEKLERLGVGGSGIKPSGRSTPGADLSQGAGPQEGMKVRQQTPPPAYAGEETRARQKDSVDGTSGVNSTSGVNNTSSGNIQWKALLNYVKNKKMSAFTYLNAGKPVRFDADRVVIGFGRDHAINREALDTGDNRSFLEEALSKVTGASPRLELTLLEFLGEESSGKKKAPSDNTVIKEDLKPMIEKAMDVFGGSIVRDSTEGYR